MGQASILDKRKALLDARMATAQFSQWGRHKFLSARQARHSK
jgi:hypothetical protein